MRATRKIRPTFSQAELQEKNVYEVGRLRSELQLAYMERETLQSSLATADRQNELLKKQVLKLVDKISQYEKWCGEIGAHPIFVDYMPECSICRGNHGPEIRHACE